MKPGPFAYRRAADLEHALELLAEAGEDAKLIAGGQSLVAMMSLRLARPSTLIDIDRLPGLGHVLPEGQGLRVGALVRHAQLERYPARLHGFELLREAARLVGHLPIRTRGTFGGSIAHADAAAEWCAVALLHDARIRAVSRRGRRELAADEFFRGLFTTALEPDEVLTEVLLPRGFTHAAIREFARRHGDFATALTAVGLDLRDGVVDRVRVVLGGVADRPVGSPTAERLLAGQIPSVELFAEAGRLVASELDPPSDLHGSSGYRRRLAGTLTVRALAAATGVVLPPGLHAPWPTSSGGRPR